MQITTDLALFMLAVFSALGGLWWRVEGLISAQRESLAEFKTEVAKSYASMQSVREVEARLVTSIDRLSDRIDTMPDKIARLLRDSDGRA